MKIFFLRSVLAGKLQSFFHVKINDQACEQVKHFSCAKIITQVTNLTSSLFL